MIECEQFNLDLAINYSAEINSLYKKNAITRKDISYFAYDDYTDYSIEIVDSDWRKLQYVVLTKENKLLAFISANFDRVTNNISNLALINITDKPSMTILRGALYFIDELLFKQEKFHKINFKAIKDNPAIRIYKKYIATHDNARIVGELVDDAYIGGEYHNSIMFEFMNPDNKKKE